MQKTVIKNTLVAVCVVLLWPVFLHATTYYAQSSSEEAYVVAPIFALPLFVVFYAFKLTSGTIWERSLPIACAPLLGIPVTIAAYSPSVYGDELEQVYFFAFAPALMYWIVLVGIAEGSPAEGPHIEENDV